MTGMPSTHALSLFFFGSYLAVTCLGLAAAAIFTPKPQGISTVAEQHEAALDAAVQTVQYGVAAPICVIAAGLFSWQRVTSGLHTPAQVVVGGLIGGLNGAAWKILEGSAAPQLAAQLPDGTLGTPGVCALICVGAVVVGWSELRKPAAKAKPD